MAAVSGAGGWAAGEGFALPGSSSSGLNSWVFLVAVTQAGQRIATYLTRIAPTHTDQEQEVSLPACSQDLEHLNAATRRKANTEVFNVGTGERYLRERERGI